MANNRGGIPMYNENPQYSATISSQLPQGSPAMFGTQVAKERAGLGDAMTKLGTTVVDWAVKMQERDDNAFILEKDNQMRQAMTDLLYNPQTGLANQKGKNSFGVTQTYDEEIEKLTQNAMSEIGSPVLQAKLQEHNMQWVNSLRTAIAKHEGGERFTYYSNQMSASSLHAQNFGLQIGGLEGMQASIAMRAGLRDTGKSLLGWDDTMADNWEREENSKTFSLIAKDFIDRGDIGGLQSLVDAYGDKVTGAALTDAKSKLKVITQQQDAAKLAEQLIAEHPELIDEDGNLDEAKYAELVDQLNGENAADRIERVLVGGGGSINTIDGLMAAISGQESGGNYDAQNGRTGAYGKYQIMPGNWPSWSEEAGLGSNAERTPENQEKVARYKLNQYLQQYGAEGAMVAWYSGPGNAERWVNGETTDVYGRSWDAKNGNGDEPSIREYVQQVSARGGKGGGIPNLADVVTLNNGSVNIDNMNPLTAQKLAILAQRVYDKYHFKLNLTEGWADGTGHDDGSWHYSGQAVDIAQDELKDPKVRKDVIRMAKELKLVELDEYETRSANWTGDHVHFSDHGEPLPEGASGGSHYVERRVSGYNPVLNSAMKAYGKRKADMIKGENERQITTWANALFENPNVINARDQSEIDVEMDKMGIPRNKRAKVMARVNYSMSVNNSRVSRERSDESYDRTKKTWREQDASDKLAGWMKNNPNATTQQVLEMGDQLGISNKEYIAIRDSKGGAGAKLKNAYAWAKDPNNEKAFNDTISGLKLNSLQKANIRIYLNNLSEERMGKNEPPLTDEDIIAEVKKKAGKVVINKGTTGIYGGEEITEADLPPGAERTEYGVLLNGYTMAPVRDDNGTIVDWKVMNAD